MFGTWDQHGDRYGERHGKRHGGSVVAFRGELVRAPPAEFARLRGYWEGLRQEGAIPARAAVDPRGFADLLECSLLVERIAPGMARIRLAGMALCDLLGMDLRGMPLSALILPESRDRIAPELERVFATPATGCFTLEAERGIGRPALSARLLLLPLTGRDGTVDRALGCLVTEGRTGRAPRRFALSRAELTAVDHVPRPIARPAAQPVTTTPPAAPSRESAAPAPGFFDPPAGFDAGFAAGPQRPAPVRPRPHLRLVRGDE